MPQSADWGINQEIIRGHQVHFKNMGELDFFKKCRMQDGLQPKIDAIELLKLRNGLVSAGHRIVF